MTRVLLRAFALALLILTSDALSAKNPPRVKEDAYRAGIRTALASHERSFRLCFEREGMGTSGIITTELLIASDGHLSDAKIQKSTTQRPPLDECVMDAVRGIEFPPPPGGVEARVTYPIRLYW